MKGYTCFKCGSLARRLIAINFAGTALGMSIVWTIVKYLVKNIYVWTIQPMDIEGAASWLHRKLLWRARLFLRSLFGGGGSF